MQHISKSASQPFSNSPACLVYEYGVSDPAINGAVSIINGRYPETGFAVNHVCKELVYVISGTGSLTAASELVNLSEGDVALIQPGERYHFQGQHLKLFLPCTPAWHPEQHQTLPE